MCIAGHLCVIPDKMAHRGDFSTVAEVTAKLHSLLRRALGQHIQKITGRLVAQTHWGVILSSFLQYMSSLFQEIITFSTGLVPGPLNWSAKSYPGNELKPQVLGP